jgi:hypothetical protein
MQMLGPNNEKPMKVKYVYPKTRKELGIPDQQKQNPYTEERARWAETVARWKQKKDAQCVAQNGVGWSYNLSTGQCQLG